MRVAAVTTAVLIAAGLSGPAAAQDRPAAYSNAEACLDANVDAAVAASSGAADAAEFLLGYLCAGPVAAATKYEVNSDLLASGKGLVEGFLTMMPAETAMTEDFPDFDAMTDEEIDAWILEQEGAATATAESAAADAAAAAAAAAAEAPAPTEAGSPAEEHGDLPLWAEAPAVPVMPTDPFEGISVDPVTGEIVTGDNPMGPIIVTFLDYMEATARSMSGTPPAFLRERAAELIVRRRRR